MSTNRLEAFSDGVIAIIITIMVLELHPPQTEYLNDLLPLLPKALAYLFSFFVLAIYWNNHHHLMRAADQISASVMWANMHLLFWLSLIPFATAWLGEPGHYLYGLPVFIYASIGLLCGIAYYTLSRSIIKANPGSELAMKIGKDKKGVTTLIIYLIATPLSFIAPVVALALVFGTAIIWLMPDRRLEGLFK